MTYLTIHVKDIKLYPYQLVRRACLKEQIINEGSNARGAPGGDGGTQNILLLETT
jgi:hypothetical protein